ncbi:MAG: hypothetical protein ACO3RV_08860 [Luteolibacter sp.]
MKLGGVLLLIVMLVSCAAPEKTSLMVKQFVLRDQVHDAAEDPMVRMEKLRHLHGAVSMEERSKRLGQYYSLVWNDPDGVGSGEIVALFEYQQGDSRIRRMTREFPADSSHGVAEFAVVGNDYVENGRVLAWRASIRRGDREIASRQSYLWQ